MVWRSGSAGLPWDMRQHPRHRMRLHSVHGFLLPADSQEPAPDHVKSLSPWAGDGFCLMTFNESSLVVPN